MNPEAGFSREIEQKLRWLENVQPTDWKNPRPAPAYNLVVIGAGTAGLGAALGAAALGAKVALVENQHLGGLCLNAGGVLSQSLIKASRLVRHLRPDGDFGVGLPQPSQVDFGQVMARVRKVRSELSWNDSATRISGLGVDVFWGAARFHDRRTVRVADLSLRFSRALIATGSRPILPEVAGLPEAGFLTSDSVFEIRQRPQRLAVLGGGPLGCELAQAFLRLGVRVLLLEKSGHLLDREDADAAALLQAAFAAEGMDVVLSAELLEAERRGNKKTLRYRAEGQEVNVVVDEILVATGRAPRVDGLDLEKAGVHFSRSRGVAVNAFLQTSNPRIFAAGDVCTARGFRQGAEATARVVVRNALFPGKTCMDFFQLPRCIGTDPEIGHVGRTEKEIKAARLPYESFTHHLRDTDRGAIDQETTGFIKVHAHRKTHRLLGATCVGAHAGELLPALTLAMQQGLTLGDLARMIQPYPAQAELLRQAALAYKRTRLTPVRRQWLARWLVWQRR
ncbi:MAG: FAD-containing oxidoreductase [Candidatus Firestonebacteria bacterium]|nr:FAD-containing oxidoreductase [Candidatus Firestonebacteria bacterium]